MSKRKELENKVAEMAKELETMKGKAPVESEAKPEVDEPEAKPKRKRRTLKKIADKLIGLDDKPTKGMSLEVDDSADKSDKKEIKPEPGYIFFDTSSKDFVDEIEDTDGVKADEIEADEDIVEVDEAEANEDVTEADDVDEDVAEVETVEAESEIGEAGKERSTGSVLAPEPNVPLGVSTLKQLEQAKQKAREMRLEAVKLQDEAKATDKLIHELEEKAKAEAEAEKKAKAEAAAKAAAEAKAKAIAEAKAKAKQPAIQSICQDGPRNAYRFWSPTRRAYLVTTDLWIAEQLCPGDWKTVKVWMANGQIDHILTEEEIVKYYNLL